MMVKFLKSFTNFNFFPEKIKMKTDDSYTFKSIYKFQNTWFDHWSMDPYL